MDGCIEANGHAIVDLRVSFGGLDGVFGTFGRESFQFFKKLSSVDVIFRWESAQRLSQKKKDVIPLYLDFNDGAKSRPRQVCFASRDFDKRGAAAGVIDKEWTQCADDAGDVHCCRPPRSTRVRCHRESWSTRARQPCADGSG